MMLKATTAFASAMLGLFCQGSIAQQCASPISYAELRPASVKIDEPSDYIVAVTKSDRTLHIAGDVISLDPMHFPFLFPPNNSALPSFNLVVEGRSIVLSHTLRLKTGTVSLSADTIGIR